MCKECEEFAKGYGDEFVYVDEYGIIKPKYNYSIAPLDDPYADNYYDFKLDKYYDKYDYVQKKKEEFEMLKAKQKAYEENKAKMIAEQSKKPSLSDLAKSNKALEAAKAQATYDELKKKYAAAVNSNQQAKPYYIASTAENISINSSTAFSTQYNMIFPKKPAPVEISTFNDIPKDVVIITVKIGQLQQKQAFTVGSLHSMVKDGSAYEVISKAFEYIVEVRPDVLTHLKKMIQQTEEELFPKKTLTTYAKGGMVGSKNSVGRRKEVDALPGLKAQVKNPVTGYVSSLEETIIALNDTAKWSRERIADWLETLDVDIKFKTAEAETPKFKGDF